MTTETLLTMIKREIALNEAGFTRTSVTLAWIKEYLKDYTFDDKA